MIASIQIKRPTNLILTSWLGASWQYLNKRLYGTAKINFPSTTITINFNATLQRVGNWVNWPWNSSRYSGFIFASVSVCECVRYWKLLMLRTSLTSFLFNKNVCQCGSSTRQTNPIIARVACSLAFIYSLYR